MNSLNDMLELIDQGVLPCQQYAIINRTSLTSWLSRFLVRVNLRTLIPPLIYKLHRCNQQDVNELTHFLFSPINEPTSLLRTSKTSPGYSPVVEK